MSGLPASDRVRESKDLGEIMVFAHATVRVQAGHPVVLFIEERGARREAARVATQLGVQHDRSRFDVWSTRQVLQYAAGHDADLADPSRHWIHKRKSWEVVYDEMRGFDDGLAPR